MDQRDHIATLCAASTLGVAPSGLAFGVQGTNVTTYASTPGKRKWPGASSIQPTGTSTTIPPTRRVISQPVALSTAPAEEKAQLTRSTSLFRRQSKRDVRPTTASDSDPDGSRGSSMNRSGLFRPRTSESRSTSERRDPSVGSSWLKRISMASSQLASTPSVTSSTRDSTPASTASLAPDNSSSLPNKLVKRSTSQKALHDDQIRSNFLRRPATSHQRSATVQEWTRRDISFSTPATPYLSNESGPTWRPFFESGYSRKRHTSTGSREFTALRTISPTAIGQPTLVMASQVELVDRPLDDTEVHFEDINEPKAATNSAQRLKRSLSSVHRATRRRNVTDPTVKVTAEVVNGTITTAVKHSPRSPLGSSSPFSNDLPRHSPLLSPSPALASVRNRFSFRKRQSLAPSDPTTVSSDSDARVFTDDDESMDFHTDTPYDSLTTRASTNGYSASRLQQLDTVFAKPTDIGDGDDAALNQMMQNASVSDHSAPQYLEEQETPLYGMGIIHVAGQCDDIEEEPNAAVTPIKVPSPSRDDLNATPVASRNPYFEPLLASSPPIAAVARTNGYASPDEFILRPRIVEEEDEDDIDWSPKSERQMTLSSTGAYVDTSSSPSSLPSTSGNHNNKNDLAKYAEDRESDSEKRLSSIFDWSEQQKVANDYILGGSARPKTVHGKQGHDNSRSRSSGRKGPPQLHLRSQSVPTNRDTGIDPAQSSSSKFGTWGLGHKPVSEEWSEDFEFDDVEEEDMPQVLSDTLQPVQRQASRGVRVPQDIIDRQASVHVQFGQVQEFMHLVEELKQLRAKGAVFDLLETNSCQLWKDAESIIELATINNEEDDIFDQPNSPTTSDIFGDEPTMGPRLSQDKLSMEDQHRVSNNVLALRSVSSPATPPHGRPRGESLAQAKTFLQSIHQHRNGFDSSPMEVESQPTKKLPFDTQDLKDLVTRSGVITRALKEIVRKAENISVSPVKTPPRPRDPPFSQIFTAPDSSPCPPFRKPGLPKSKSANGYSFGTYDGNTNTLSTSSIPATLVL